MSNTVEVQRAIKDACAYLLSLSDEEFEEMLKNRQDHGYTDTTKNMIEANIQECETWGCL
jgi:hypothetical protein